MMSSFVKTDAVFLSYVELYVLRSWVSLGPVEAWIHRASGRCHSTDQIVLALCPLSPRRKSKYRPNFSSVGLFPSEMFWC